MFHLHNPDDLPSPALLVFPEIIRSNLRAALRIAGQAHRLRPHVKTHKTREIVRMALDLRITNHKCATLAEAAMLAECGASEVLLAYPLVGPNIARFANLAARFRDVQFAAITDDLEPARQLSAELCRREQSCEILLDVNVGQNRTGVTIGEGAVALYAELTRLPGLKLGGLHVYDGHHRHENLHERELAVNGVLAAVRAFRAELERRKLATPRLVLGGTPTFPIHARLPDEGVECSPGTFVLHDVGYRDRYSDVGEFQPAAAVLTRVLSRPGGRRITFDVGTKSIAADPPMESRCQLQDLPDARIVAHNEEHLVVESELAERFPPGSHTFAFPAHVCPTVALYPSVLTVENGSVTGSWTVAARDH